MSVLQEYKCPCCGGGIAFDSALQRMKCPYCDTEFDVETLAAFDNEIKSEPESQMSWESAPGGTWEEGEEDGLCSFICSSCGGEIVGDETLAATSCPYCGNPVVMAGRLSGSLKPDFVIPFKLDKAAAKDALRRHYGGKRLLPKIFKDENHIDEVKGIYVPFWLFDTDADAHIRYRATRTASWADSNYIYRQTDFYSVTRAGRVGFSGVPVDGSTKIPDELMESIEPFDLSAAVDFKGAYLAGFSADKYDVSSDESIERANERIKKSTEDTFASSVHGFSTLTTDTSSIRFNGGKVSYALLPVWLLNTTWRDKKYTFAMNGQTGKLVGDLPTDTGAYIKWLLALTGIIGAVSFAASFLLWLL